MKKLYFISHGSPMTVTEKKSDFYKKISNLKHDFDTSKGIIVISAHWLNKTTTLTSSNPTKIIYDFYGFPDELYKIKPKLSGDINIGKNLSKKLGIKFDEFRGFDHGTWSILNIININSNIPIFQLSINTNYSLKEHLEFGKKLNKLRSEGYIILGSGGLVHNLSLLSFNKNEIYDWAKNFEDEISKIILNKNNNLILNPTQIKNHSLAIPEYSHYFPLLYIMGALNDSENIDIFHRGITLGNISMLSFKSK